MWRRLIGNICSLGILFFFFSSRRRHTRFDCDWSSDVCSSDLVAPTKFVAKLQEPPVAGDATSSQQAEQLPTYNAYSIAGDVTAPLAYVTYGVPADYGQLERMGISVKGAIVIARYFGSWRGIKPKVAA